jgi:hypothetical protein
MRNAAIVVLAVIMLTAFMVGQCPEVVTCPQDGVVMHGPGNCMGVGRGRTCEYYHTWEENGRLVTHRLRVNCPNSDEQ